MSVLQTLRQRMQREQKDGLHSGPSYRDIPTTASKTTSPMGKIRKDMRLQNQGNQMKPHSKSLRAGSQNGVTIPVLQAAAQQELDRITRELDALEKEYPSKVYDAVSQKADLDVDVPMLGPVATGSTLQKETADYSGRKLSLEESKKTLEEALGEITDWEQYYEKWGYITDESWFSDAAATRDYVNPSDEDLEIYDVMMDNKRWEVMPDGSMQDALGNPIPYESVDENHTLIHPMRDDPRYVIQDPLGLYLSTSEDRRFQAYKNQTDSNGLKGSKDRVLIEGWENHWEQVSEDETNMYYALLKEKGVDSALEYLAETAEIRNSRWGKQEIERIKSIDNDFKRFTETVRLGVNSGIDQWGSGVSQALTGEKRINSGLQYANAEMSESMDGLYRYMYQATNTVGNMLPSIVVSNLLSLGGASQALAGTAGSVVAGVSSGGNAYGQALREGYSKEQARSYSMMVGAAEFVLQDLIGGISALGGIGSEKLVAKLELIDDSLLRIAGKLGAKIGSEISEESMQLFLEPAFRSIIFGEVYDAPTVDEILDTAVVTALSTSAMEGPSTVFNDISVGNHTPAVDTGFQNYYDNIIQMGGDVYGEGQDYIWSVDNRGNQTDTYPRAGRSPEADAKRPGIQKAVGETGEGSAEVHLPGGQHRGLTASNEDFGVHDYVEVDKNTDLDRIQQTFEHNGIECRIVRGDAWKRAALAYAHNGRVYISQAIDKETLPTVVSHETTHVMKQCNFGRYRDFLEQVPDCLQLQTRSARRLLNEAAKHRGVDIFEMSDTDFINLYDEMNAIVYGMYQSGILDDVRYDYGTWIPSAFKDFDGYIRQMDAIHAAFRQQNGAARTDPSGEDASEVWSPGSQITSREALAWVLENKELQEIDPRTRRVLQEYDRHLQQLQKIRDLQSRLQVTGTDANTSQLAERNFAKLGQLYTRHEQRLTQLEKNPRLQQLAQKALEEIPPAQPENVENSQNNDIDIIRTYDRIKASGQVITDGSHLQDGKLKPNVTYESGEYDYIYQTDGIGRICRVVIAELKQKIHTGRLAHNKNTYGKQEGDHAGHLIGDRFGGSPELDNLVSQAALVNLSKYKKIENQWAKAIKVGKRVSIDITVNYDGGTRPTSFDVVYFVDEKKKSKTIQNNNIKGE